MTLIERIWAAVTSITSLVALPPILDNFDNQIPLQLPLSVSPIDHDANGLAIPGKPPQYPYFPAPGATPEENFTCKYPDMIGWEDCSTELNRGCWLRHKATGREFNITTDYENEWPNGTTRYYNLDLTDGYYDADGYPFDEAKLFNHSYPGPWVQACWGDRLVVNVTNHMKHNGTSVHWHGIRQLRSVHMDGVNGITQCPIAPGDFFVYNFTLKQYGSSWYHSHYSMQYADGAVGPLTIHGPFSGNWDYPATSPILMTDWYHNSSFMILADAYANGFDPAKTMNGHKNILLNGRGDITKFNNLTPSVTKVLPLFSIDVTRGKRYLLRVINTSFDTTFVFSIDNHILQVVSADFVPIYPYQNTSILVGIGQRYNVIVEANPLHISTPIAEDGNYWIRTQVPKSCIGSAGDPGYETTGILRYNSSSNTDPTTMIWPNISLSCSDETYTSLKPILPWKVPPPVNGHGENYGEEFDAKLGSIGEFPQYPVSLFTLDWGKAVPMRINYSDPMILHLNTSKHFDPPATWRVQNESYTDKWVYLVINNTNGIAHPIHLHGHDFAILAQESTPFDPKHLDLNHDNPPRRDVVLLPKNGYVVMAFKTDNPGPWLVHCHIAEHISLGLGMQIMEDQEAAFKIWPDNDEAIVEVRRVCGNWDTWYNNMTHWAEKPLSFPGGTCNATYGDITENDFCFQNDAGV